LGKKSLITFFILFFPGIVFAQHFLWRFSLFPEVRYDDNIYLINSYKKEDLINYINFGIEGGYERKLYNFSLKYKGSYEKYTENPEEDTTEHNLSALANLFLFKKRLHFEVSENYRMTLINTREPRVNIERRRRGIRTDNITGVNVLSLKSEYIWPIRRLIDFHIGVNPIFTAYSEEDVEDVNRYEIFSYLDYKIFRRFSSMLKYTYTYKDFEESANRNEHEINLVFFLKLTPKISISYDMGYKFILYEKLKTKTSGTIYNITLSYIFSPRTTFFFSYQKDLIDSSYITLEEEEREITTISRRLTEVLESYRYTLGYSRRFRRRSEIKILGYYDRGKYRRFPREDDVWGVKLEFFSPIFRRIYFKGSFEYQDKFYLPEKRSDNYYSFLGEFTYALSRLIYLGIRYEYLNNNSNVFWEEYDNHRISFFFGISFGGKRRG